MTRTAVSTMIVAALLVSCGHTTTDTEGSGMSDNQAQEAMTTAASAEQKYFAEHHTYSDDLQQVASVLKPPTPPGEWSIYHVQVVLKDDGSTFCVQGTSDASGHTFHYDLGTGEALDGGC